MKLSDDDDDVQEEDSGGSSLACLGFLVIQSRKRSRSDDEFSGVGTERLRIAMKTRRLCSIRVQAKSGCRWLVPAAVR